MFKKSNRLSKSEFSEYFNKGTKKHFPHLTIITCSGDKTKVAVVAGKKVAKSAVRRNTLRRRVYATLKKQNTLTPLGIMIVILKPSYNSLPRKNADEFLLKSVAHVVKNA